MAGKRSSGTIADWPDPGGYRLRVHWDDTDCTKRVYLGKYIKWIDDACTEYLRERGLAFDPDGWLYLNGKPLDGGFVVGEYTCRIEHASGFDDVMRVKIGIKEKRSKVVVFRGDIFDAKGRLACRGTLTYIYIKRGMPDDRQEPVVPIRSETLRCHRPGAVASSRMKAVEMPGAIFDLLK